MMRRGFLIGAAAFAAAPGGARAEADPSRWLRATRFIDRDDPLIVETARSVTAGQSDDTAKALALFDHVRDQTPFGFAAGFWNQSASAVLRAGRGYCNTKSTLFVALLRATGVPARQVFVEIDAEVLHG